MSKKDAPIIGLVLGFLVGGLTFYLRVKGTSGFSPMFLLMGSIVSIPGYLIGSIISKR